MWMHRWHPLADKQAVKSALAGNKAGLIIRAQTSGGVRPLLRHAVVVDGDFDCNRWNWVYGMSLAHRSTMVGR